MEIIKCMVEWLHGYQDFLATYEVNSTSMQAFMSFCSLAKC